MLATLDNKVIVSWPSVLRETGDVVSREQIGECYYGAQRNRVA